MLTLNYVYVIGNGHAVKIGKSVRPEVRMSELSTASHAELVPYYVGATNGDGGAIEREAHAMLAAKRLNGEWFDVLPGVAIGAVETAASRIGAQIMRCDDGLVGGSDVPPRSRFAFWNGYRAIWATSAPIIHKINLTVLRAISQFIYMAVVASICGGAVMAIQFFATGH